VDAIGRNKLTVTVAAAAAAAIPAPRLAEALGGVHIYQSPQTNDIN